MTMEVPLSLFLSMFPFPVLVAFVSHDRLKLVLIMSILKVTLT